MKIIAGNWKMNGTATALAEMLAALSDVKTENKIIICPPISLLWGGCRRERHNIINVSFGAQDCSVHESGAYTGEVSAEMIAATGAKYIIVGHSERREYHAETNEIVRAKAERVIAAGLMPIICVGETKQEYEQGETLTVIERQIKESIPSSHSPFVVAYEPVWAIGTGLVPTTDDIAKVHNFMRNLTTAPLLYGGSVKPGNAADIMRIPNVDGVLVGGASLKPAEFVPIIEAI